MAQQRATVRLSFSDGSEISSFLSCSMREKFTDPLDTLSFTCAPPRDQVKDYYDALRKGELVAATVNGRAQVVGMVDTLTVRTGASGVMFDVEAVAPIKVLYEATADQALTKVLQSDASVLDLVSDAVAPFGLSEVAADQDVAAIKAKTGTGSKAIGVDVTALKYAEAVVQPNETVYQFLARILTRLGVMLRMDPGGLLMVTRPHYDQEELYTLTQGAGPGGGDHFFGDVEVVESNAGQFSFCEIVGAAIDSTGETRANVPRARVLTTDIISERPPFRASEFISHKPLYLRDTNCRDAVKAKSMAKLKLGTQAETAFYVRGEVDGLVSTDGVPWTTDTLCGVYIEPIDLSETMWISERTLEQDARGGQRTSITLVPKNAITLGDSP